MGGVAVEKIMFEKKKKEKVFREDAVVLGSAPSIPSALNAFVASACSFDLI